MSVLAAYERFRFLWGAVDWEAGSESPYTSAQTGATLGTSAAAGAGVGVRRCVVHYGRGSMRPDADDCETHFDFLNITGGSPDDTWTPTDYETLEAYLDTWWGAIKSMFPPLLALAGYHWYRHGPGVTTPNPAERVTSRVVAGTGSNPSLPPQCANTITFRTGVRRSWGRTYLPQLNTAALTNAGELTSGGVTQLVNAAAALVSSAIAADFPLVVTSTHLSAVLNVEAVEVDSLYDVIRRRRYRSATTKTIVNT